MKQIIKPGKIKEEKPIIYKETCPACGCVFTFSNSDFTWIERSLTGSRAIQCPFCQHEIVKKHDAFHIIKGE